MRVLESSQEFNQILMGVLWICTTQMSTIHWSIGGHKLKEKFQRILCVFHSAHQYCSTKTHSLLSSNNTILVFSVLSLPLPLIPPFSLSPSTQAQKQRYTFLSTCNSKHLSTNQKYIESVYYVWILICDLVFQNAIFFLVINVYIYTTLLLIYYIY